MVTTITTMVYHLDIITVRNNILPALQLQYKPTTVYGDLVRVRVLPQCITHNEYNNNLDPDEPCTYYILGFFSSSKIIFFLVHGSTPKQLFCDISMAKRARIGDIRIFVNLLKL